MHEKQIALAPLESLKSPAFDLRRENAAAARRLFTTDRRTANNGDRRVNLVGFYGIICAVFSICLMRRSHFSLETDRILLAGTVKKCFREKLLGSTMRAVQSGPESADMAGSGQRDAYACPCSLGRRVGFVR
jgi:hypothetical protein